jgi:DNA-directed RNA polymerase specialized sigma24 family protein
MSEITRLLQRHHEGDRAAFDEMVPLVYARLRVIARGQLARGGRRGQTLDTTALVQEVYLQMVGEHGVDWQDRAHFYAVCARAMRRILVDYARRRQAQQVLAVNDALQGLAEFNERLARVVECRYFAGLTEEETALALGSSLRTVQRDWMRARAWLQQALS